MVWSEMVVRDRKRCRRTGFIFLVRAWNLVRFGVTEHQRTHQSGCLHALAISFHSFPRHLLLFPLSHSPIVHQPWRNQITSSLISCLLPRPLWLWFPTVSPPTWPTNTSMSWLPTPSKRKRRQPMTQESESDEETEAFVSMHGYGASHWHMLASETRVCWARWFSLSDNVTAIRVGSQMKQHQLRRPVEIANAEPNSSYAAKSTPTTLQTSLPDFRQAFLHTGYATTEGLHSSVRRRIRVGSAACPFTRKMYSALSRVFSTS